MSGKYEVFAERTGGYGFRLKANNGEVIASSENFKTKAEALKGIESLRSHAKSHVVDLTEPTD
ncbi:DUF1508 domain-containing protein [Cryobacterium sp. TMT1-21]|uniref:DUF1508 domain-containing protein n=1 Tax=Cryobacterium shii TaxID=1259235 RepID=A0AAQ2HH09_9MICO|nr:MULTISPECIES: DUF1508 domain-containing protein [Cryobacterium]TFC53148.1 DUF1508 domain-containing protein [Cryobacterium shii]TFC87700.1 DUF1508 domain-containing protein [Cryobacterium sp. TmT2-59]TFD10111.1 DUF1508 domain-containing protein [Cryobacterium sp. TMT1-21]TFD20711.1 DUF1508 domain-containing protein [Cryobacterium sp. TMT2-23]TFD22054.1 DUF1508 domain-containing protein [Cryobacterium sp. TMT4-10]